MFDLPSVIRITRVLVGVEEGDGVGERGARSDLREKAMDVGDEAHNSLSVSEGGEK